MRAKMEELVNSLTIDQYFSLVEIVDGKVSEELRSMTTEELYSELDGLMIKLGIKMMAK